MKKLIIILILLSSQHVLFSQNLDLIVTTKGDSIACKIDSIGDSLIYLQLRTQHSRKWVQTLYKVDDLKEYKYDCIETEKYCFKKGTSIITTEKGSPFPGDISINNISKNSVYVENIVFLVSVNYDRIIPVSSKMGIALKVGLYFYGGAFLTTEATFLAGGIKHFFEVGGGWGGKDMLGLYGRFGYRYIGEKGFIFKGGVNIIKNVPIYPSIGIGYSF